MSDLIRRNDAVEAIEFEKVYMTAYKGSSNGYVSEGNPLKQYNKGLDDAIKAVNSLPSAEPERTKGKWKKIGHWGRHYRCDQCGNTLDFDGVNAGRGDANFCPNCGAALRGE